MTGFQERSDDKSLQARTDTKGAPTEATSGLQSGQAGRFLRLIVQDLDSRNLQEKVDEYRSLAPDAEALLEKVQDDLLTLEPAEKATTIAALSVLDLPDPRLYGSLLEAICEERSAEVVPTACLAAFHLMCRPAGFLQNAVSYRLDAVLEGLNSEYAGIRQASLFILAKSGDGAGEILNAMLNALDDPDAAVQKVAAASLAEAPFHSQALIEALTDRLAERRDIGTLNILAAVAEKHSGNFEAPEELVSTLSALYAGGSGPVRQGAVGVLGKLHDSSDYTRNVFLKALTDKDEMVVLIATMALPEVLQRVAQPEDFFPAIASAMQNSHQVLRGLFAPSLGVAAHAAELEGLEGADVDQALPLVEELLSSEEEEQRKAGLMALPIFKGKYAEWMENNPGKAQHIREKVIESSESISSEQRLVGLYTLHRLEDYTPAAMKVFKRALNDPNDAVRSVCRQIIVELSSEIEAPQALIGPLIEASRGRSSEEKTEYAVAICHCAHEVVRNPELLDNFEGYLEDFYEMAASKVPAQVHAALLGFASMGSGAVDAIPEIASGMKSEDTRARTFAYLAAYRLSNNATVILPLLRKGLEDEQQDIVALSVMALSELAEDRSAVLDDYRKVFSEPGDNIKLAVLHNLNHADIMHEDANPFIIEGLRSDNESVVFAALSAIAGQDNDSPVLERDLRKLKKHESPRIRNAAKDILNALFRNERED